MRNGTMRFFPFSSCLDRAVVLEQNDTEKNQVMLFLNVYDLIPANDYLYWFGLGFYHSGIEIHGLEYAFEGGTDRSTGVFEVEPRSCPNYIFRRSILVGTTDMSRSEVCSFMELISDQYRANSYDLIYKNCNHFTDEICYCLTGKHVPEWVNRLARVGCFIDAIIPGIASFKPFPEVEYPDDGSDSSETEDLDLDEDLID